MPAGRPRKNPIPMPSIDSETRLDAEHQKELASGGGIDPREKVSVPLLKSDEYTYKLPRGYEDENGNLHDTFTTRFMRGEDETAIGAPDLRQNLGKFTRIVVERMTESVGDFRKSEMNRREWGDLIQSMYIGDIDYMFATIMSENADSDFLVAGTCDECGHTQDYEYSSRDLTFVPFKNKEVSFTLAEGILRKGEYFKEATLRSPTSSDREAMGGVKKSDSDAGSFDIYIARLLKVEGVEYLTATDIKQMLTKDRRMIRRIMEEKLLFGPDNKVRVTCAECGAEFEVEISAGNFT